MLDLLALTTFLPGLVIRLNKNWGKETDVGLKIYLSYAELKLMQKKKEPKFHMMFDMRSNDMRNKNNNL